MPGSSGEPDPEFLRVAELVLKRFSEVLREDEENLLIAQAMIELSLRLRRAGIAPGGNGDAIYRQFLAGKLHQAR